MTKHCVFDRIIDFLRFWLDIPAATYYYRKCNRISISRSPVHNCINPKQEEWKMKTLEALLKELNENVELKKEFEAAADSDTVAEFLKKQGCDATLEELIDYMKAQQGPKVELSDEELKEVSGGRDKKCVTLFGKKLCI